MLRSSFALLAVVALPALSGVLNDTGITSCADDYTSSANCSSVASDSGSHPRQDGRFGRDAPGGGNGFDFRKLDASGGELNANAVNWDCTRDNVTGLVWEVKTNSGLRNQSHTYSWYKTIDPTSGLGLGTVSGGTCENGGRCDTEKYVADVNAAQLCGASDWRMPTVKELESLSNFSRLDPAIDLTYFQNTAQDFYWTGTLDASLSNQYAWLVEFMDGSAIRNVFATAKRVRLVRGTAVTRELVLTDNGTTVTDSNTRLTWKRDYEIKGTTPAPWGSNTDKFSWPEALKRAVSDRTGGHSDWRLPNIKELRSLIDESKFFPAIDKSFFPDPIGSNNVRTLFQGWFWSSSPYLDFFGATDMSWVVGGDYGQNQGIQRHWLNFVRLVRDADDAGPTVPDAPRNLVASSSDGGAIIAFDAPASDGGATIDSYRATCTAGASTLAGTAAGSPVTVTGMTNGIVYSCEVVAHNSVGDSISSTQASVTPVAGTCSYSLSQSSDSGAGAVNGNVNLTTGTSCAWTAVSNTDWLTVASGAATGTGNGSISYAVAANTTENSRNGTLTIGGQTFTYIQAGLPACSYNIDPNSKFFLAGADTGSVSVTTANHCNWTASGSDSWISMPPTSGSGSGSVAYSVTANTDPFSRTGTLTIAGKTHTVTQAGAGADLTGTPITRYRVYSDVSKEHLYTTDRNEYDVLVSQGWSAEGAIYKLFQGAGSMSGVVAVPYYRLYNPSTLQHHWTSDQNEYNVLGGLGWSQEGVDGYILPIEVPGALPLYRLFLNAGDGFHLWTTDANEKNVLTSSAGWVLEGVAGYVLPLP